MKYLHKVLKKVKFGMVFFKKSSIEHLPLNNYLASYITSLLLSFTDDQKPFLFVKKTSTEVLPDAAKFAPS